MSADVTNHKARHRLAVVEGGQRAFVKAIIVHTMEDADYRRNYSHKLEKRGVKASRIVEPNKLELGGTYGASHLICIGVRHEYTDVVKRYAEKHELQLIRLPPKAAHWPETLVDTSASIEKPPESTRSAAMPLTERSEDEQLLYLLQQDNEALKADLDRAKKQLETAPSADVERKLSEAVRGLSAAQRELIDANDRLQATLDELEAARMQVENQQKRIWSMESENEKLHSNLAAAKADASSSKLEAKTQRAELEKRLKDERALSPAASEAVKKTARFVMMGRDAGEMTADEALTRLAQKILTEQP
jgi:chromosome segregation ATPase